MRYEAVVGLEIHAQVLTESKMFCRCARRTAAQPNTLVCPVCLGLPGALPVVNSRAVDLAVKAALALGCRIHLVSVFARKNYFYPDLPKGYQITQYDRPLATDGAVTCELDGATQRVGITRIHLEEDAGKSLHEGFADSARCTYVDFNRSGVPLIEIVTAPDFRSSRAAADFFSFLRAVLVELGVNDGNLEEGSLRCDANVSVRPEGTATLGTKTEIKNLNSFRFLERALRHEIERQTQVLATGGTVAPETRLWDARRGCTIVMRTKEAVHDYRYFPEPDLPPLEIEPDRVEAIRRTLPELPEERKHRLMANYDVPAHEARLLAQSAVLARYFEEAARAAGHADLVSHWVVGEVARKLNEAGLSAEAIPIAPAALGGLIALLGTGRISGPTAKTVFEAMWATGRTAEDLVRDQGLTQIDDEATLAALVAKVVAEHPKAVAQYRAGRTLAFGFLVGQVMKATGGRANPRLVNDLLRRALHDNPR